MAQSSITSGVSQTQIRDKGQQLADLLRPNTFGLYNGNPKTLSEWLIYIIAWPIFMPLTWVVEAARWLMVATKFTVWHILGMIGLGGVEPLLREVDNALPEGNPFKPLLALFLEPESEFGASIVDQAIGGTVSAGLGLILDPLLRPAGYVLEENFQNKLPPEGTIITASLRGTTTSNEYATLMSKLGYSGMMSQAIREASISAPDVNTALTMWNRGYIDEATAQKFIRYNDVIAEFMQPTLEMRKHVPSSGDVYNFAASHVYSEDLVGGFGLQDELPTSGLHDAARNGMDQAEFAKGWIAHWNVPNVSQAFDAFHRGIISQDNVNHWLKYAGIPTWFRPVLTETSRQLVTQRYIRNLLKYGVWNYDQVYNAYKKIGFSDDNAKAMSDLAEKMLNPIQQASTVSEMTSAYADSIISYDVAFSAIRAAGYSDYETQLHLAIADVSRKKSITSLLEQIAKKEYTNGITSIDESMALLRQYGVNEERVQLLAELWPLEQSHTQKNLSESDLRTAYAQGFIDVDYFRYGLILNNYTEQAADLIVSMENAKLEPTRIGGIPAGISTTGALKMFTKAELKSMLVNGLIGSEEWAYQMALLGYSEEQISLYAQLIMESINKTKASG